MTASYEKAMFGPRVKTQGQCPRVGRCPRLPPAGRGRGRTLPRSPQKKRPLSHPDPPDHEAIKAQCPSRAVCAVSFRTRPPTTAPRGPRGCPHGGTLPSSVAGPCSRCSSLVSSVGFRLPLLGSVPESRELPRRVPLSFPRPAHGRRRTHASEGNARARCLSSQTLPGPWPLRATGAARATAQVGSSAKNEWFRQTQTE